MAYTTETGTSIERAAELLKDGRLVAMPTETVYGLAGNALDPEAVARIYEVKERPLYNPLIVHVADVAEARALVREWPAELNELVRLFWPGPLTLLLEKGPELPDLLTAGLSRVAIRLPDHAMARDLIRSCGFPLAAPSANLFSRISPTSASHVQAQLEGRIPYILDGGPCEIGLESTILGRDNGHWVIYRPGAVTAADLAPFLGIVHHHDGIGKPQSPGMLPLHYSPRTPLHFGPIDPTDPALVDGRTGLVLFGQAERFADGCPREVLAPDGRLRTAAQNLYAALHRLDGMGLERLLAEPMPEEGIGRAINDRLRRAAGLTGK